MGRVDAIYEQIFSNQLLSGVDEFDSPKDLRAVKKILRPILKGVADRIIMLGKSLGHFQPLFDQAVADRYIDGEELDQEVARLTDEGLLPDPDGLFLLYLDEVAAKVIESLPAGDSEKRMIVSEMVHRSLDEVHSLRSSRGELPAGLDSWIDEKRQYWLTKLSEVRTCETIVAEMPAKRDKSPEWLFK